jgi:hypothetical protein
MTIPVLTVENPSAFEVRLRVRDRHPGWNPFVIPDRVLRPHLGYGHGIAVICLRLFRAADDLQASEQRGPYFSPTDQQQWSDRIESSPTPLPCTDRIGDVQHKRRSASSKQKVPRWAQRCLRSAGYREMPGPHQQA